MFVCAVQPKVCETTSGNNNYSVLLGAPILSNVSAGYSWSEANRTCAQQNMFLPPWAAIGDELRSDCLRSLVQSIAHALERVVNVWGNDCSAPFDSCVAWSANDITFQPLPHGVSSWFHPSTTDGFSAVFCMHGEFSLYLCTVHPVLCVFTHRIAQFSIAFPGLFQPPLFNLIFSPSVQYKPKQSILYRGSVKIQCQSKKFMTSPLMSNVC